MVDVNIWWPMFCFVCCSKAQEAHIHIWELLCTLEGNIRVMFALWYGHLVFEGCKNPSVDYFLLAGTPLRNFMVGSKSYATQIASYKVLGYETLTIPLNGLIKPLMKRNVSLSSRIWWIMNTSF